jgi:hypothetical protein
MIAYVVTGATKATVAMGGRCFCTINRAYESDSCCTAHAAACSESCKLLALEENDEVQYFPSIYYGIIDTLGRMIYSAVAYAQQAVTD